MPKFECKRCHRSFTRKYNLERHEDKKKQCEEIEHNSIPNYSNIFQNLPILKKNIPKSSKIFQKKDESSNTNNNRYTCDFCDRNYKQKFNLNKHLKTCKEKIKTEKKEEEDKKLEILNAKIKLLELKKALNITNNTNNNNSTNSTNNTNSNNTVNINNNIILNDYGKENIDFLKDQKYKKLISGILKHGINGMQKYISYKYCNPNQPENMTIKYTNQRSNKLKVRKNNKWKTCDKRDVLEELYDRDKNVEEVLNVYEHVNDLDETEQMDKIQISFLNMVDNIYDDDEEQNDILDKAKSSTLDDLYNCYAENKDIYK